MNYLDKIRNWMTDKEIEYAVKYLKENSKLLSTTEMSTLYDNFNGPNNRTTTALTAIFLDIGVDPLKYLKNVPKFYGVDLFEGKLVLPNNIELIDEHAFVCCKQLNRVVIGNNVKTIKNWAFSDCVNLEVVNLPKSINQIESYAFSDCIGLHTIIYAGTMSDYDNIIMDTSAVFNEISTPIDVICSDGEFTI